MVYLPRQPHHTTEEGVYQPPTRPITEAETAVLSRLIAGGSPGDKQIAADIGCSSRTVHAHLRSVASKIGVRGRIDIALWAAFHLRGAQ